MIQDTQHHLRRGKNNESIVYSFLRFIFHKYFYLQLPVIILFLRRNLDFTPFSKPYSQLLIKPSQGSRSTNHVSRNTQFPFFYMAKVSSNLGVGRLARAGQHGHDEGRPVLLPATGITHRAQTGPHTPSMQCSAVKGDESVTPRRPCREFLLSKSLSAHAGRKES